MNSLKKAGKDNEIFSKINEFPKESKKKNQKTKKQFTEIIESVQDLKIETEIILKNGN